MRFKIPKIVQKLSLNIQKFNCERHVYDYNLADTPNHSSKKECSFSFRKRKLFKLKIPLYAAPVTSKRSSSDGTIVGINYSYSTAFDIPKSNLTDRKLSWPRVETSSCCSQTTVHPVSAKESQEYFFWAAPNCSKRLPSGWEKSWASITSWVAEKDNCRRVYFACASLWRR